MLLVGSLAEACKRALQSAGAFLRLACCQQGLASLHLLLLAAALLYDGRKIIFYGIECIGMYNDTVHGVYQERALGSTHSKNSILRYNVQLNGLLRQASNAYNLT